MTPICGHKIAIHFANHVNGVNFEYSIVRKTTGCVCSISKGADQADAIVAPTFKKYPETIHQRFAAIILSLSSSRQPSVETEHHSMCHKDKILLPKV